LEQIAGDGVIFALDTSDDSYNLLHTFGGTGTDDGAAPMGSLLLVGTTLYGTTSAGGQFNDGTVFSLDTVTGDYDILHTFSGRSIPGVVDGADPMGGLTLVGSTLYGTTSGPSESTIFAITLPEPSSVMLMVIAGGMALRRRRG
jgi:uncharacterized repeat protein (TIGR03803 family)